MPGRPFSKGKSGNPNGRPRKSEAEVAVDQLCRIHTPKAVERLAYWMASDNAKASVAAAKELLDRAHGRPRQQMEHTGAEGGALVVNIIRYGDASEHR